MLCEVGLMENTRSPRLRPLMLWSEVVGLLERHRLFRLEDCLRALALRRSAKDTGMAVACLSVRGRLSRLAVYQVPDQLHTELVDAVVKALGTG